MTKLAAPDSENPEQETHLNRTKLMRHISDHMTPMLGNKQRRERANKSLLQTLTRHLGLPAEELPEIKLDPKEEALGKVFSAYLALASLQPSLAQTEYYFRRFPFSELTISRADHLRNICEMYFDRIEQFRQRLKALVTALKGYSDKPDKRYGDLVKQFSVYFKWEQTQRNQTHHHRRFEYDAIDQLGLIELLRYAPEPSFLPSAQTIYRQEANKWVKRVRSHSKILEQVVEVAAGLVLEVFELKDNNLHSANEKQLPLTPPSQPATR